MNWWQGLLTCIAYGILLGSAGRFFYKRGFRKGSHD